MPIEKLEVEITAKNNIKPWLDKAKDDIKWFNERVKSQTAIDLSINSATIKKQLDDVRNQIKQAKASWDFNAEITLTANAKVLQNQLTQADRELRNFLRTWEKDVSVLWKLFWNVTSEISKTRDEIIKMWKSTTVIDTLAKKAEELQKQFNNWKINTAQYSKELNNLKNQVSNVSNWFWWFSWILSTIVWLWLIDTFRSWVWWIIWLWTWLQQTTIAFTSMLHSWELASNLLKDLSSFAKETPFEINWIRTTAKQLLAFWFQADEIIPTLKKLWDVSAWLSVPIEQVAYAYWQVRVANQLYWTELRQFVNAWIPLLSELAKQFWVTESEAKKLVENWKVWFKDVEKAFANMTWAWWLFENAMESQSQTVAWLWSNLKDTITLFAESIWTTFLPAMTDILKSVLSFTTQFPWLTKVLWLWSLALVWIWWIIALVAPAIWWLTTAFIWLRVALALLWWPVGLIIWWLTALAWVTFSYREELWLTTKKTNELSDSQIKLNEITWSYSKRIEEVNKKQEDLNKKFDEWTISNEEYKKSSENNKIALEQLALSQVEVQKWLDIINDKQLNYKQKVEALNWLKLSDSEYQKLIWVLQSIQQETLKAIQLQQELLKSKIAWLKAPTTELKKAAADLNNAFNIELTSWIWSLSTNQNKINLKLTKEQINAQEDYRKQVKISNEKNSVEVSKYNKELQALKKQEEDLIKISRDAQDILKKPVTKTSWSSWWSWGWGTWKSEAAKAKEKELKELKDLQDKANKQDLDDNDKLYNQKIKTQEKFEKDLDETFEKEDKALWKLVELWKKSTDLLSEFAKDLKDEISWVSYEIDNIWKSIDEVIAKKTSDLWSRAVEIQNQISELSEKWITSSSTSWLSEETLLSIKKWGWWTIWNVDVEDLLEFLKLQRELEIINKNITQDDIKQAELLDKQTEVEKIIIEAEKEKTKLLWEQKVLEEQKNIAKSIQSGWEITTKTEWDVLKAFFTDEKWQLIEIQNQKNIIFAQELLDKKTNLENQLALIRQNFSDQLIELETYDSQRQSIESYYTIFLWSEIETRKKAIDSLIEKLNELKAAGWSLSWTSSSINTWTDSSGTNNTTDNSSVNVNMWWVNVNNNVDIQFLANEIARIISWQKKTNQ